ncbi:cytochrome C554 [Chania multitudinisentens RB-25]|uniref:Cytochrome C554 n=1 Tax=Chania multitudinisentens RB-25 TaxID=1441930 RepID=W0L633_9GAMM|nr:cytochrome c [Chania multitudinisentens]AHG19191.1 cytochrome C554 [Chania multitudinisentens RB-25]
MKSMSVIVVAGLLSFSALAAGDAAVGKNKSVSCVACHGAAGKVSIPMYPNLAGQNAMYLEQALLSYKKGERSGGQAEVMRAYVLALSDTDIADLAAYYASLQP